MDKLVSPSLFLDAPIPYNVVIAVTVDRTQVQLFKNICLWESLISTVFPKEKQITSVVWNYSLLK